MDRQSTQKTSSYDVARHAGVSQAAVSYVLSGRSKGMVSDATRDRVLEAARELKYTPNNLARALLKGKTYTIGCLTSYLGSQFHAEIIRAMQNELQEHGYSLLICVCEFDRMIDASRISFLMGHRVDAIILVGGFSYSEGTPDWMREALNEKLPCMIVDDASFGDKIDCVVSDDLNGLKMVVNHLKSLGHERIAYFPGSRWASSTATERLTGFARAMADAGLSLVTDPCPDSYTDESEQEPLARKLLSLEDRPTAIVAANDHQLVPIVHAANDLGLRIPEDLALVGYGDEEISRLYESTTVSQESMFMGKTAAQRLLRRLGHGDDEAQVIRTPVRLIPRRSTIGKRDTKNE